ncbi:unnamed protein product, partial [Hapterophycus canaliculatus]
RIAARLFCLTGYPLSAVAPEDARVLCEAAGDSLDWGLGETEPRLVSQPIRRETREQKRKLVLRIKPLFELMEKASTKERLQAEEATGVVSRKASPDGFRYEDRETGKPVDHDAYKGPYLKHVQAARATRLREFAARRMVARRTLPQEGRGSSPTARKGGSSAKVSLPPSVSASAGAGAAATKEEMRSREKEDPPPSPPGAASEEPLKETENLVGAPVDERLTVGYAPSRGSADDRTIVRREEDADEDNTSKIQIDVAALTNAIPSGVSAGAGVAAPETPKATIPGEQGNARDAAAKNAAASEIPVVAEAAVDAVVAVGTREKVEDAETLACAGSETSIAGEGGGAIS